MFFCKIFILNLLLAVSVFASNKMTYYGCPEECHTQENPSCGKEITTDYFAALSTSIGDFCDKYVVVMETKANAKKLVRAKVVDTCGSCATYHVDLSKKAFTTLTEAKVGKSEIIWAIYDGSGSLVKGPFYNSVSEVASSYGLSGSSFVSAFKVAAGKIASSGSSSGSFAISRGSGGDSGNADKKTTAKKVTTTKKITSVTTRVTTTTERKVITTVVIKKTATSNAPAPTNDNNSSNNTSNNNSNTAANNNSDNTTGPLDGETPDTISYGNDSSSNNNGSPTNNTSPSKSPVVMNKSTESSGSNDNDNGEVPIETQIYEEKDEGGNTGATVGVITAITCIGAGGVGLAFMKKKNPNKYDELKKKFPEAFTHVKSGIKRSVTKMRGGQSNVTLPSHDTYMPPDTIGEDGLPRIALYDNPPANQANPVRQV